MASRKGEQPDLFTIALEAAGAKIVDVTGQVDFSYNHGATVFEAEQIYQIAKRVEELAKRLNPKAKFADELLNEAIELVCRAFEQAQYLKQYRLKAGE